MQRFHRMKTLQQYMKSTIGGIVGSVFLDWHLFHRSTTLSCGSLDALALGDGCSWGFLLMFQQEN